MAGRPVSSGKKTGDSAESERSLSKDRIVAAARHLMETEGLESVTMRKVAKELRVTAMALYHHVKDKHALVELVADQVMEAAPEDGLDSEPWYERLRHGFLVVHQEIARYPGLGLYISGSNGFYPSGFKKLKSTMKLLIDAGFDEREAIEINYIFLAYQGGYFLLEQSAQRPTTIDLPQEEVGQYAKLRTRSLMNSSYTFIRGLDMIIAGFRAQLAAKQVMP